MSLLLWHAAWLRLVDGYRRFDKTYRSHLQGLSVQEDSTTNTRSTTSDKSQDLSVTPV